MPISLANYQTKTKAAVRAFWSGRRAASQKQAEKGEADRGERGAVTAGNNMDGFIGLMTDLVRSNGLKDAEIHLTRKALTLPGFFRPTKLWDMLVLDRGMLVAALEFKSQAGPSFGNNFNNRTEEAIGTAHDFWTAYREGAFGDAPRPFLGWLILVEDAEESRRSIRDASPHFGVFPEFSDASYIERYHILCRKLIQEQLYTAATVLASPRKAYRSGEFSGFEDLTSLASFVSTFAGHIAAVAARQEELF
ncbi:MAG: hypothetical protein JNK37_08375 [Verrucomicrobiales bacterium]|nr:hypothetical protein [Verrucomicrobiales bacterium]